MVLKKLFYILVLSTCFFTVFCQEKKEEAGYVVKEKVEFYDLNDALKKPESVTSLKLNRLGLTALPSELAKFTNLTELDLSDNQLNDLSSVINQLTRLEALNLSGNKLTVIPDNICGLKNLKTLNLSNNKIASGSLSCMSSLERVYLNSNALTTIPSGLSSIRTLKSIYLHNNQITVLPDDFAKMPNLETFFIQFNKIQEEPNVYRETGIVNYMFNPQSVNTKYLYKYYQNQSRAGLEENGIVSPLVNNNVSISVEPTPARTNLNKWERMGSYLAIRGHYGIASHKAIREDDIRDQVTGRLFAGSEIDFGFRNYAIGLYASQSEVGFMLDNSYYSRVHAVTKMGLSFKLFLTPLSSKVRPYVKLGAGINMEGNSEIEDADYYGPVNLQARVGVDVYIIRFFGLFVETGVGAGNLVSAGTIIRIPFNKRG